MKKFVAVFFSLLVFHYICPGQDIPVPGSKLLFQGMVMDAKTEIPLSGTQILINNRRFSVSNDEGKFAFYVNRRDTVLFERLGYKPASMFISDTLSGNEYIAGIYLQTDTVYIDAVIIFPRLKNLKSDLLNSRPKTSREMENAKYNMAISAYQGRITQNKLGDPATNYKVLQQKQSADAYSKGQIPSDQIVGINPLLLIPAAYLLIHGLPEKPAPLQPELSDREVNQIHQMYLDNLNKK
jgi:hypothetical protein